MDRIKQAIQSLLDELGDGWTVAQYVVAMGLERIDSDGNIEGVPWVWSPPEQPGWQTLGLLERACTETHYLEFEDED